MLLVNSKIDTIILNYVVTIVLISLKSYRFVRSICLEFKRPFKYHCILLLK